MESDTCLIESDTRRTCHFSLEINVRCIRRMIFPLNSRVVTSLRKLKISLLSIHAGAVKSNPPRVRHRKRGMSEHRIRISMFAASTYSLISLLFWPQVDAGRVLTHAHTRARTRVHVRACSRQYYRRETSSEKRSGGSRAVRLRSWPVHVENSSPKLPSLPSRLKPIDN